MLTEMQAWLVLAALVAVNAAIYIPVAVSLYRIGRHKFGG